MADMRRSKLRLPGPFDPIPQIHSAQGSGPNASAPPVPQGPVPFQWMPTPRPLTDFMKPPAPPTTEPSIVGNEMQYYSIRAAENPGDPFYPKLAMQTHATGLARRKESMREFIQARKAMAARDALVKQGHMLPEIGLGGP